MIKTRISIIKKVTPSEKFFLEKSLELLSPQTIDTYRLRINNPKSILYELMSVIDSVKKGSLRENYIHVVGAETLVFLKKEKELFFKTITKAILIHSISQKNINQIYYCANIIISENKDYVKVIFNLIKEEIKKINDTANFTYKDFDDLNRYIQYFYIELIRYGYTKQYLTKFLLAIFCGKNKQKDFATAIDIIETLINREREKFKIYFGFQSSGFAEELLQIDSFNLIPVIRAEIESQAQVNKTFSNFLKLYPNHTFYYIEQVACDYYSAASLARKQVLKTLDLLFVATDDDIFNVLPACFVFGTREPEKGKAQNLTYRLDGHFVPSIESYKKFIDRYKKMNPEVIDNLTLKKIYSTLRYLRFGTLATEQEHKLLNYWIAIEYLYSSISADESKTQRLNEYFKKIHSNSYVRRLYLDLHSSINVFKIAGNIPEYDAKNIAYLLKDSTEAAISSYSERYPLLYYRFMTTKDRYSSDKQISNDLKRHSNNIEWNLYRIYRTRNEIVHSAATDIEVIELAGHLKYFIIFTLNALFAFLISNPLDITNDRELSIDDFFLLESLKFDSLISNEKITVEEQLRVLNPIEYLQSALID